MGEWFVPLAVRSGARKPTSFSLNANSPQAHGLVSWWPMGPTRGGYQLFDGMGGAIGSNVSTNPVWVQGQDGGHAVKFDGVDDCFIIQNWNKAATIGPIFSVCFWSNIFAQNGTITNGQGVPAANWGTGGPGLFYLYFDTTGVIGTPVTTAVLEFTVTQTAGQITLSENSFTTLNTWHHHVAVADGTNLQLYRDGVAVSTTLSYVPAEVNTSKLHLGIAQRPSEDGTTYGGGETDSYTGTLEDMRFYSRALSLDDIKQIYNPQTRYNLFRPTERIILFTLDNEITPTGGVVGGGTATVSLVHNPASFQQGVVAGGTAPNIFYNVLVATGGVVCSGIAIRSYPTITATGGAVVAGTASVVQIYVPSVTGGARGGGAATPQCVYNPTATGGARGGGIAVIGLSILVEGGIVVNGSSSNLFLYIITSTGGAVAGSSATVLLIYAPPPTGGVVVNGSSNNRFSETAPGGVVCAGVAVNTHRHNPASFQQGVVIGGVSEVQGTYNRATAAGVLANGTAGVTFYDIVDLDSYGVVCAGHSSSNETIELESAGVAGGGAAVFFVIFTIPTSAGLGVDLKAYWKFDD